MSGYAYSSDDSLAGTEHKTGTPIAQAAQSGNERNARSISLHFSRSVNIDSSMGHGNHYHPAGRESERIQPERRNSSPGKRSRAPRVAESCPGRRLHPEKAARDFMSGQAVQSVTDAGQPDASADTVRKKRCETRSVVEGETLPTLRSGSLKTGFGKVRRKSCARTLSC